MLKRKAVYPLSRSSQCYLDTHLWTPEKHAATADTVAQPSETRLCAFCDNSFDTNLLMGSMVDDCNHAYCVGCYEVWANSFSHCVNCSKPR